MADCKQCDALRAENAAHNHAEVKYLVEIDELRAEVEKLRAEVQTWQGHVKEAIWSDSEECKMLTADNERLRAALHEAADELDAYYRVEYPGDHPYSKRKLAEAMRQNPARIAITQENIND